jgi:HlyD family secretion protein
MMKKSKKILICVIGGVVVVLGIVVVTLISNAGKQATQTEQNGKPAVTTMVVKPATLALSGQIKPVETQRLTNPVGKVTNVAVTNGQKVVKRTALLTTDDTDAKSKATDLASVVSKATRDLNEQNNQINDLKNKLAQAEDEAKADLQTQIAQAQNTYNSAKADLGDQQKQLSQANAELTHTLYAPFDGIVALDYGKDGEVQLTMTSNDLQVSAEVTEFDYQKVADNHELVVSALANNNKQNTTINFLAKTPAEDSKAQNVKYLLTAPVDAEKFMNGQSAKIQVKLAGFIIPSSTVVNKKTVYLVRDGKLIQVEPTMTQTGENYTVTDGLTKGDRIVTYPASNLHKGQAVQVVS